MGTFSIVRSGHICALNKILGMDTGVIVVELRSPASRRGWDKQGRRRSAAMPPNEPSQENVGKM